MSKHHREHNWAPSLTEQSEIWQNLIKEGITIADDHTHMLSVVDFAKNLNQELSQKGREPIAEPSADDLVNLSLIHI